MAFEVPADAYGRFMGRWSEPLAETFVRSLDLRRGQRALDVGCGPGALTRVLVDRLGSDAVAAVEPSEAFLAAVQARLPGVDARRAPAEQLPFDDGSFDASLAQLVVHFMADPVAGLSEMRRVTRPGGCVAASVWDHAGGSGPLGLFWSAVRDLDPASPGEADLPGTREGHLLELFAAAGLSGAEPSVLTVTVSFASFEDWWEPFGLGVGPAGDYVSQLTGSQVEALREECARRLPEPPFELSASAWCVTAEVQRRA